MWESAWKISVSPLLRSGLGDCLPRWSGLASQAPKEGIQRFLLFLKGWRSNGSNRDDHNSNNNNSKKKNPSSCLLMFAGLPEHSLDTWPMLCFAGFPAGPWQTMRFPQRWKWVTWAISHVGGHAIWISRSTDYWVLGALIWQWTTETGEALGTCLACCPTCRFDIFQNSWWLLTEGTECSCKVYVETTWHHYCMTTYHLLPCLQKHVNPFFCWHFCLFSFKVYNTW